MAPTTIDPFSDGHRSAPPDSAAGHVSDVFPLPQLKQELDDFVDATRRRLAELSQDIHSARLSLQEQQSIAPQANDPPLPDVPESVDVDTIASLESLRLRLAGQFENS